MERRFSKSARSAVSDDRADLEIGAPLFFSKSACVHRIVR